MIKIEKGTLTMGGYLPILSIELERIIRGFINLATNTLGNRDSAIEMFEKICDNALMDEEELEKKLKNEFGNRIDEAAIKILKDYLEEGCEDE